MLDEYAVDGAKRVGLKFEPVDNEIRYNSEQLACLIGFGSGIN